jgi:hypothetical protein
MYFRKIVKKKGKDMEKEQVQLVYLTPAAVSSSAASEWLLLKPVIGIVVIAAVVLITMAVKAMRFVCLFG